MALASGPAFAQVISGSETCVGGPVDPAAFALAEGVVDTMIPPERADAMMQDLMRSIMSQMKEGLFGESSDAGLQAILDRKLKAFPDQIAPLVRKHMPSQKAAVACAYVREFSLDELRGIRDFSQSLAGKHYLSRSTAVISDPSVVASNQAYFGEAKVYLDAFRDDLVNEVRAYLKAKGTTKR